jgi:hypothetical protein
MITDAGVEVPTAAVIKGTVLEFQRHSVSISRMED